MYVPIHSGAYPVDKITQYWIHSFETIERLHPKRETFVPARYPNLASAEIRLKTYQK